MNITPTMVLLILVINSEVMQFSDINYVVIY